MKRILAVFIAAVSFGIFTDAGTITRTLSVNKFDNITVSNEFSVEIRTGLKYSVDLTVDERINDYCEVVVNSSTLYIKVNKKEYPGVLKSQLRKSANSFVTMNAVVTIPASADFKGIRLEDSANVSGCTIKGGKYLAVTMVDKSTVNSVSLNASEVDITIQDKASIEADVKAGEINLYASNGSKSSLNVKGTSTNVEVSGSPVVFIEGENTNLYLRNDGKFATKPDVELKGRCSCFTAECKGDTEVRASGLKADEVILTISHCAFHVYASRSLKLSMEGNAKLAFDGSPDIDIVRILNSTVERGADKISKPTSL